MVEIPSARAVEGRRRSAAEWHDLLLELVQELATGRFYNRDLPTLVPAMHRLSVVYLRRMETR